MATPVAAVVLAAGAATRFGTPKQSLLLPSVLGVLGDASVGEIVIVQGAHQLTLPESAPPSCRLVSCPAWTEGPGASLRCGLEAVAPDVPAAIVILADGPELDPRAVDRLIRAWADGDGAVLSASYDGTRSHPVLIAREHFRAIPIAGLRDTPVTLVDCSDLRPPGDIDTPEDLQRMRAEAGTSDARTI